MKSPEGWLEPGQTPEFDEYTVVISGELEVETRDGVISLNRDKAILIKKGEWVRYSSPSQEGAHYVSVCLPAFTPDTVNRDSE